MKIGIEKEMLIVVDLLKEEIEGVNDYEGKIKEVESEPLKEMLNEIVNQEKRHIFSLAKWISDNA